MNGEGRKRKKRERRGRPWEGKENNSKKLPGEAPRNEERLLDGKEQDKDRECEGQRHF